jgi:RNA polymerase sigma-70 factor (ECF subfamily)
LPDPSLYDEKEVLKLLSLGSEYAFTQVFDRYRDKIYSIAFRFLKSPVYAEETVQDVFLKLWMKRAGVNEIRHFENYLFTMSRNHIFDQLKKQSHEQKLLDRYSTEIPTSVDDTDFGVRSAEYQKLLDAAIDQLSPQQKKVYRLAKINGLSHEAIAVEMSLTKATVKNYMANALISIRHYLDNHLDTFVFIPLLLAILPG